MLKQLYIRNFTLIEELNISFSSGFSVITGETGAGKSIILGAIGLLLGNRADAKYIMSGKDKCVIEAHFDISNYDLQPIFTENDIDYDGQDCILRREINANGKSRAFINDSPVALATMKELGDLLIDVHSQHQNLLLNKEDFQLYVLDIIGNNGNIIADYEQSYTQYKEAYLQLEDLKKTIEINQKNEEFLRFQYNELNNANLLESEQEELEQAVETLNHAEDIKSALFDADTLLSSDENGMINNLKMVSTKLHAIETAFPKVSEIATRIDNAYIDLKDAAQEIASYTNDIDFDPQQLDEINTRLDTLYTLEKKFHTENISDLIKLKNELGTQLEQIDNSDEEVKLKKTEVDQLFHICSQKAEKLSTQRADAAKKIEKDMLSKLATLGIPKVRFEIQIEPKKLSAKGADKVSFMFSANMGNQMQPISQVASGGEIARVMLSLKAMISKAVKLPTIIFDEIDTGVSGRVAEKMAQIMQEMGNSNRQVISITHLPQIAALGATHYKVSKKETSTGTISTMTILNNQQRIKEIAQMLSGSDISNAAIENAKSLLNNN